MKKIARVIVRDRLGRFAKANASRNLKLWYGSNLVASGRGISKKIVSNIREDIEESYIVKDEYKFIDAKTGKKLKKFDARKNIIVRHIQNEEIITEKLYKRGALKKKTYAKRFRDSSEIEMNYALGFKELVDRYREALDAENAPKKGELKIRIKIKGEEDLKIENFYYDRKLDFDGKTLLWNIRQVLDTMGYSNYTGENRGKGKEKYDLIQPENILFQFVEGE